MKNRRSRISHLPRQVPQSLIRTCMLLALHAMDLNHATASNIQIVAQRGLPLPGLSSEEIIANWRYSQGINDAGQIVMMAEIRTPHLAGTQIEREKGIWIGRPDNLKLIAREGQTVTQGDSTLQLDALYDGLSFNHHGEVAFLASVSNHGQESQTTALFCSREGALQIVAMDGDAAPGFEGSITGIHLQVPSATDQLVYHPYSSFSLNDRGEVVWTAAIEGTNHHGVWLTSPAGTILISKENSLPIQGPFGALSSASNGNVVFATVNRVRGGEPQRLFLWNGSSLNCILEEGRTLTPTGTTLAEIVYAYLTESGRINLEVETRRPGKFQRFTSLWQFNEDQLSPIHIAETDLTSIPLRSRSAHLVPYQGNNTIPYWTCSNAPEATSPVCEPVIHVQRNGMDSVVAYHTMPLPQHASESAASFYQIPGLHHRTVIVNDNGLSVSHLGIVNSGSGVSQALFQLDESQRSAILSRGDQLELGDEESATATYFELHPSAKNEPILKLLNDRNELLTTINTLNGQSILAVVSLKQNPPIRIEHREGSLRLNWQGEGLLEQADTVAGPWSRVANQDRSQVITSSGGVKFYRVTP